jgi:hypothetical protein
MMMEMGGMWRSVVACIIFAAGGAAVQLDAGSMPGSSTAAMCSRRMVVAHDSGRAVGLWGAASARGAHALLPGGGLVGGAAHVGRVDNDMMEEGGLLRLRGGKKGTTSMGKKGTGGKSHPSYKYNLR